MLVEKAAGRAQEQVGRGTLVATPPTVAPGLLARSRFEGEGAGAPKRLLGLGDGARPGTVVDAIGRGKASLDLVARFFGSCATLRETCPLRRDLWGSGGGTAYK